ncbi:hypothetical protein SIID45300_00946 [Candidatus Magnetaquicoccaceae bacterium FCR-1]|uniref:Uncharacterized protein n=1 Tax=Candidatus Magnetaquiglobus chichijimensis TaxID=3141448 RepID=A0ABQ0C6W9_9PROT
MNRLVFFLGLVRMQTYAAVTRQVDGWSIGWIEEVSGVNAQKTALLESLVVTLNEALAWLDSDVNAIAVH